MEFFISPTVMSVLHRHTEGYPQPYAEKVLLWMAVTGPSVIVRGPGREEFYFGNQQREESRRQKHDLPV
jgi:hypothetical protein